MDQLTQLLPSLALRVSVLAKSATSKLALRVYVNEFERFGKTPSLTQQQRLRKRRLYRGLRRMRGEGSRRDGNDAIACRG